MIFLYTALPKKLKPNRYFFYKHEAIGKKMSCPICTEACANQVVCGACNAYSCRPCFQEYVLSEPLLYRCMFCRESLPAHFVEENTPNTWWPVYAAHRSSLLYTVEKPLLQADQTRAAAYAHAKALCADLRARAQALIRPQKPESILTRTASAKRRMNEAWDAFRSAEKAHMDQIASIQQDLWLTEHTVTNYGRHVDAAPTPVAAVVPCPKTDCPGTLIADTCPLCTTKVCLECHKPATPAHACNPDDVASVKAVSKEAKPCPSCRAVISKVDGCDQMWCTQCHVTFSWLTGQQDNGTTHNPHYYEWRRQNGGLAPIRAAPCRQGLLTYRALQDCFSQTTRDAAESLQKGWLARRNFCKKHPGHKALLHGHLPLPEEPSDAVVLAPAYYCVALNRYHAEVILKRQAANHLRNAAPDNYTDRIRFLASEIDEPTFKGIIEAAATKHSRDTTLFQIYDMAFQASADIFIIFRQAIKSKTATVKDAHDAFVQLRNLFLYTNTVLKHYGTVFDRSVDKFNTSAFIGV